MKEKNYLLVSGIIFLLIALLHLLRIIFSWNAQIANLNMPIWVSWVALIISGYLAFAAFRLK